MGNQFWLKQAWTIARIELRRAFFSKRAFWVYGLALIPAVIFFAHGVQLGVRRQSLSRNAIVQPALLDSIREGETPEAVIQRVGKPSWDRQWERHRRVSASGKDQGVTTHNIDPAVEARYVRLNIRVPSYNGDPAARIFEFEVYGNNESVNLALNRPATGSTPCSGAQGPEKAVNGSVKGGETDCWCSRAFPKFLQVDLGAVSTVKRVVVKHASAGGESQDLDTMLFDIQASTDGRRFMPIVTRASTRFVDEITVIRSISYFDGRREATLEFEDGKLTSKQISPLMNFEEDRRIFAGVFQYFYLPLAVFFGCLGIFMNLFRGEMIDKTLHFWFLVPARREVLLFGKYGAGLIASSVIFAGGTLLCFGVMLQTHGAAEVHAYWHSVGMAHAFWYTITAVMGCIGYGSVFLAAGMLLRNPIIPAAVLLAWEGINGFLPEILQKLSVLYYLQCLCPVPAPTDENMPALLKLLLSPAAPVSRAGAIIGLLAVTALVLWIACIAIRRMEVSYTAE
jgi:hypothetical protein